MLIRRLADIAATPGLPWSTEHAALALQSGRSFEDTAMRPAVYSWATSCARSCLSTPRRCRGCVFAPGYASAEEAGRRLHAAEAACRRLKDTADQLRAAIAAWDDATASLVGALPLVSSGAIAEPVAEQLADATRRLGDALTPPAKSFDLDEFAARATELERLAIAVRAALADFSRPFRPDSLEKLRARAEITDAGAAVVAELDEILATPLVPVADRKSSGTPARCSHGVSRRRRCVRMRPSATR